MKLETQLRKNQSRDICWGRELLERCAVWHRKTRSLYWSPNECWESPKIRTYGDSTAVLCYGYSISMSMWSISLIPSPVKYLEKMHPHTAFGHDLSMRRFEKSSLTAAYRHANTVYSWWLQWEATWISWPLSSASVICTFSIKGNLLMPPWISVSKKGNSRKWNCEDAICICLPR